MRVISGYIKGKRLFAPEGNKTRPTPDRVKESLFSILGDQVMRAYVLDLFSGSGALGIESVSRGAKHATFVENNPIALKVLYKNIHALKSPHTNSIGEYSLILPMCVMSALKELAIKKNKFHIIFIDPPYYSMQLDSILEMIYKLKLLKNGGIVVCEHHVKESIPKKPEDWEFYKNRSYSHVMLSLFKN